MRRLDSGDQGAPLISREIRCRVHHRVNAGRHLARLDHFNQPARADVPPAGGEIEPGAALLHVMADQECHRGDVRVPGPDGLVAVAVVARRAHQLLGLR